MQVKIYRLTFLSALHLADVRQDYGSSETRLHSDTLHAAFIAALARVGAALPENGKVPFAISSLFPFRKNKTNFDYFFPKPQLRFNTTFENPLLAKKMKKVEWLDKAYFEKVIAKNEIFLFGDTTDDMCHFQGSFLSSYQYSVPLMSFQTLPRVKVPRDYELDKDGNKPESEPFYMQQIRFADDAGLYFMVQGDDLTLLEKAMNVLQYEGIGTDRNVGNGHFSYEVDTLNLDVPQATNYAANLSLFCPENKEELSDLLQGNGHYDLIKRSGWITSDEGLGARRKSINMFREGSIFSLKAENTSNFAVKGRQYIDLSPDATVLPADKKNLHPIWRNGQSLFIPVKL